MAHLLQAALSWLNSTSGGFSSGFGRCHHFLVSHLGEFSAYALYLLAIILIIFLIYKLIKLVIKMLCFIVLPAVIGSLIIAAFSSFNPLRIMPILGVLFLLLFFHKSIARFNM